MITHYQGKISGPLLDRIDIHVDVPRVDYDKLMNMQRSESSQAVRARVEKAKELQRTLCRPSRLFANADMGAGEIQQMCILTNEARQLIELTVRRLQLSARAYHRVLKLSLTIADLADSNQIEVQHVAEAAQYRPKQTAI